MKYWRLPIAFRLFLIVLLTTLLITTVSLGVLQWALQKNFSRYVTEVEMQKLEHLNNNLSEVYQVYGSWNKAIQNSTKGSDRKMDQDELKHLPQRWLRRQYDIAQQQSEIIKNPALFQARMSNDENKIYVPSHFEPFAKPPELTDEQIKRLNNFNGAEDLPPPRGWDGKHRWLIPVPDRLGYGHRLALYDTDKKLITGDPASDIPLQSIIVDGKIVGYLGLRPALNVDDALSINFFSNQQRYLMLIYAVSIIISAIAALLLATYFKKPIHRLLNAAVELSKGNYHYRVEINSNDELGDLSKLINQLSKVLDQHEQSRRQWVADTSHELKTPISVLQAQIEAIRDGVRQATPEHLDRMMHQVLSLKKLTQDLADLAQADAQQLTCYRSKINPWDIVLHEIENFKPKFEQKQLEVTATGEGVSLFSDPDRFRQIIVNLLSNSVRYTETKGKIHLHTALTADDWFVYIDDSPLGVTDEQLQQLGERFYRVDDSRTRSTGGTGLGLALSKKIAQALGGDLQFDHSPLGGLRCTVRLNRQQKNEQ
ncbi:sensor histidine kinase efflux regulator BaeS [Acinetobacter qingfengensis]|uniref:histidine kinase n=1 Tax=Acinetobacter qingfengensis TaxID=1262585 RepID=A0A1E7QXG5_9GAMM|nr:sensor histidine kinase efflux regulator BaeS [Acinetobacter qingfengensis]KAA8731652.1 sensor histidine kinase efflux regulator BaeS [Acinetobacter qingfengensis]OEY91755.1 two-component sensor histidine kinase [Acinetobacter qingfengensis]